ncbi:unnamed protein product [Rotaria sp. Silwood1]|nr:unnamed protein product [Rotaria sp. Silwood1]
MLYQISRKTIATNTNNSVDAWFLSSGPEKTSAHTDDLFYVKDTPMNNNYNQYQQRMCSCSENSSTVFATDTLSGFNFSHGASLSDLVEHCSTFSSNTSSSGICSTFSDLRHEENTSMSSEELDFNLGFNQISNNDGIEATNLDEIDKYEQNEEDNQRTSNKSNDNTATLLDFGESNLDAHMNELEGFLRKSLSSTTLNGHVEINNDDTIIHNQIKQQQEQRASLLDESTYAVCSPDCFSVYTKNDDHENDTTRNNIGTRSNSLGIVLLDRKPALLDKPPKKVVRFADMLSGTRSGIIMVSAE